ncbi:hypothetical protein ANO11243_016260 [Dothideomycetidae sp. 11243]|nr:hypothetical protein ANO11243_016260 [fungal sp. No.11243]
MATVAGGSIHRQDDARAPVCPRMSSRDTPSPPPQRTRSTLSADALRETDRLFVEHSQYDHMVLDKIQRNLRALQDLNDKVNAMRRELDDRRPARDAVSKA